MNKNISMGVVLEDPVSIALQDENGKTTVTYLSMRDDETYALPRIWWEFKRIFRKNEITSICVKEFDENSNSQIIYRHLEKFTYMQIRLMDSRYVSDFATERGIDSHAKALAEMGRI